MSRSEEAWEDVGEQFKKLGAMFRHHYESRGEEGAEAASEEEVTEALHTARDNIKTAFGAAMDTVVDPDVHEESRQTAAAVFEALGATFSELGTDLRRRQSEEDD
jgi:hypothetical protein